jgi:hypothetical protein
MALGGNGDVYVLDFPGTAPPEVHRYDGATLEHRGVVVPSSSTSGLVISETTMMIGPNGDLYFSALSSNAPSLFRFDLDTGALVGSLAGIGGAFAFGPDGLLYAASDFSNVVERFDADTFENRGAFWTAADASTFVKFLRFDGAGNLYAMNRGTDPNEQTNFDEVFRLDSDGMQTGASGPAPDSSGGAFDFELNPFTGEILSSRDAAVFYRWNLNGGGREVASGLLDTGGSGFLIPWDFLIVPEPGTALLLIAGLLGLAGWRRARAC